jgi:hypothetical protein
VLVGLANHAGPDGTGAFPSVATLVRDPARLTASLEEYAGHPAYSIQDLHGDLERFAFLLGGSDGEPLSGLPPP